MTIEGTIEAINPVEQITERFKKREFVVKTESVEYPQYLLIQTTNDKVSLLNGFTTGQNVRVHINLNGRKHNGQSGVKYYNSIDAWKIEKL